MDDAMQFRAPLREDGLFFSPGASHLLEPYACLVETSAALRAVVRNKQVWVVGGSSHVRAHLSSLFSHLARFARLLTDTRLGLADKDREKLSALLARLAEKPGDHVILLAEDDYGPACNELCARTPATLPVLTPTGILLPAAPDGKLSGGGAIRLEQKGALRFLHGKTIVLWGKDQTCLDRIGSFVHPLRASIAGVIHQDAKRAVFRADAARTGRPAAVKDLVFDALVATQNILRNKDSVLTELPPYIPLVLLRDREKNIVPKPNDMLLFYLSPDMWKHTRSPVYRVKPLVVRNGYVVIADKPGYENGFRKTAYQPQTFDKRVYVFGPSHVVSASTAVEETYCSVLQKLLNKHREEAGKTYAVQNRGVPAASLENTFLCLHDTAMRSGDIAVLHNHIFTPGAVDCITAMQQVCDDRKVRFLVFHHALPTMLEQGKEAHAAHIARACHGEGTLVTNFAKNCDTRKNVIELLRARGVLNFDLKDCLNVPGITLFKDPFHVNAQGNALIARYIYDAILAHRTREFPAVHTKQDISAVYAQCILHSQALIRNLTLSSEENAQWLEHIPRIQAHEEEVVGAIVMNCNPFTLGHRHIIAESLKRADRLYIFVVSEDKSYFSFEERLAMIRDGVKDFGSRICVVLSGKLIISSATFPEYFCKEVVSYEPDARTDILIFCGTVAPALGISVRFFGEEPYCKVTAAYHKQLAELLPLSGISAVQIPRLQARGVAVSASGVRRILEERSFSRLAGLVPPTTMPYLIQKMCRDTTTLQQTG